MAELARLSPGTVGERTRWSALQVESEARLLFPIWPHPRFAQELAEGTQAPKRIAIRAWLTRWLPGLARDQIAITPFPTRKGPNVSVTPEALGDHLRQRFLDWYGESLDESLDEYEGAEDDDTSDDTGDA
jgi:hypothetical protein